MDTNLSNWTNVYNTNVVGNLNVVKCFIDNILKNKFSKIFLFAGGGSAYGFPIFSSYSLSKTAIVRAAENLHLELKDYGDIVSTCYSARSVKPKCARKGN